MAPVFHALAALGAVIFNPLKLMRHHTLDFFYGRFYAADNPRLMVQLNSFTNKLRDVRLGYNPAVIEFDGGTSQGFLIRTNTTKLRGLKSRACSGITQEFQHFFGFHNSTQLVAHSFAAFLAARTAEARVRSRLGVA